MSQGELRRATGIGGVNTIKRAVEGLVDKLSIRIITNGAGSVVGTNYEVFAPPEIIAARRAVKMEIHPKTKKIVGLSANISVGLSTNRISGPPGSQSLDREELDSLDMSNLDRHIKYNINPQVHPPSSDPSDRDEKLARVRKLFEQLSNGGQWQGRDDETYRQIENIPLWHIIMGLCLSVTKSPEHKMQSLAYAVPQIKKHFEDMSVFPEAEMTMLAYNQMRKTLLCITTGKWTVKEWDQQ